MRTIDAVIEQYKHTDDYKKTEKVREEEARKYNRKEIEEPYETAYTRWKLQLRMQDAIKPDGSIVIDEEANKKRLQEALLHQHEKLQNASTAYKTTGTANWTILGPIETFGQGGGTAFDHANVYCIAIAPSNSNVLYCGSENGQVFKSTNKAATWTCVSDALPCTGVTSLAIDPNNINIVYWHTGGNILKTTNGGNTWALLSAYSGGYGEKIIVLPNSNVIVQGANNIYYSSNGGSTFTAAIGIIDNYLSDVEAKSGSIDTIYATGASGSGKLLMFASVNGGISFTNTTSYVSSLDNGGTRIAVSPANPNIVYAYVLGSTTNPSVIKSTDAGFTWNIIGTSPMTIWGNGQGYYDMDIMVDPNNINNLIVATTSAMKSTDGGSTFSALGGYIGGTIGMHVDIQCMRAKGNDCYITSDGGVQYSSDFFSTQANSPSKNHGITASNYWGMGQGWQEDLVGGGRYHNGDDAQYEGYGAGNSFSLGGGESGTGHVMHGYTRVIGFNDLGMFQMPATFAGVVTGFSVNAKWPNVVGYYQFHSKLINHPWYRDILFVGSDSTLWKSNNFGRSYSALKSFGSGNTVWRFEIGRSNPEVIYVLTTNGIYKTTNAGTTWSTITLPVPYAYYNADVAVNPVNANELYICMAGAGAGNEVFTSTNGGTSWINYSGALLSGKYVYSIVYQGGTNGGVYVATQNNPSQVFYRDNTLNDWVDFSDGLFDNHLAQIPLMIFYRDNKMRLAGLRGIMETPLYSQGSPLAQALCSREVLGCSSDTVEFLDYSILNYTGATWQWTFPGASWVSSTTAKNPRVTYSTVGNYTVTLKVTDAHGYSDSKTFTNMVKFPIDYCKPDTVAGKCLSLDQSLQNLNIGTVNINSNTFSISTWIKPEGLQRSFSEIIGHYGCPGSKGYGIGYGITFSGYAPNLQLCYTDDQVNYGNYSGLILDSNHWNNVVLTYSPTGVKLYLNGVGVIINNNAMPVLDLSKSPFYLNPDLHGQGGNFIGLIDEVKIYNYTLSQNEVREKMHLIQNPAAAETGLVKYIQFNQFEPFSSIVYDALNSYPIQLVANNILPSTAPVSTGSVFRKSSVNSVGLHDFPDAHLKIYLPKTGSYPDGEMVAFHLRSNPDENPDTRSIVPGYFIVNNYGINQHFTRPDSIIFSGLKGLSEFNKAGEFKLYERDVFGFGPTWGSEIDSASLLTYTDTLNSALSWKSNITFGGQFCMVQTKKISAGIRNPAPTLSSNISPIYPNPVRDRFFIDVTAVNTGVANLSIYDLKGMMVYTISQPLSKGKNKLMVMLPPLAEGTYTVNINLFGENMVSKTFIME